MYLELNHLKKQFDGKDVVLGYEDLDSYRTLGGSLGVTVGRYANRIGGAKFTLNGKEYLLEQSHSSLSFLVSRRKIYFFHQQPERKI